jgi:hypothetical protein
VIASPLARSGAKDVPDTSKSAPRIEVSKGGTTMGVTLQQAIQDVEDTQTNLTAAQGVQSAAQDQVTSAQGKLDAANSNKATADAGVATAVSSFNAALDEIIAAATAAKIGG